MTNERQRLQPMTVPQPASDTATTQVPVSDLARRSAALAQIAAQASHHCTDDVDIEAELEARHNATGQ